MVSFRRILQLAAISAVLPASAATSTAFNFSADGSFKVGNARFQVMTYDANWSPVTNSNWSQRQEKRDDGSRTVSAKLKVGGTTGDVNVSIKTLAADQFRYSAEIDFPEKVKINGNFGALLIPATGTEIRVDGKTVKLPEKFKDVTVFSDKCSKVEVPLAAGLELTVTGKLSLQVQDNRKFDNQTYALRFCFSPTQGEIKNSSLELGFKVSSIRSEPVSLAGSANLGFSDDVEGDGKGGWTDQGSENDLRKFRQQRVELGGLRFEVLDPAKNGGRSAIIVAGKARGDFFPRSVKLPLPAGNNARAIHLLHASAWTPIVGTPFGNLTVTYSDGSTETIPLKARVDIGNWWNPEPASNAEIAWTAENPQSIIGLYASSFELRKANPVSVAFTPVNPETVWMVAGVSLGDRKATFSAEQERDVYVVPNREWLPLEFNREVVKGSPLDFSFLQDAPAGKYGRILPSPTGKLTFEKAPDRTIRLYGPNLCFSASFLDKAKCDELAELFVRLGYNAVRIHHHDTELLDPKAKDTLTFDPAKLDKLDYLFYAMKKQGLYITTDLYTNRTFKPGDNIPECDFYNERQMKHLAPISQAARDNWKEFARRWMTHKNPYTGMTWGEDPALFCLNLVNEESLLFVLKPNRIPPTVEVRYRKLFDEWKKKNNCRKAEASLNDRMYRKFLAELQMKCHDEQLDYVRNTLKVPCMLTSLNNMTDVELTLQRNKFDLVDNHSYFDHPTFPEKAWSFPKHYSQRCAIMQSATVPRNLMPTRIFGKPFLVTEFNYVNPNVYRAEGGPLIGAYASLQDWDGLFRFAWSHGAGSIYKKGAPGGFDAVNDPLAQFSDRIAILMFRRGDVKKAEPRFSYLVPEKLFDTDDPLYFPQTFTHLGLIAQIGSNVADAKLPAGVVGIEPEAASLPSRLGNRKVSSLWEECLTRKIAVSSTGELQLNANAMTFAVAAPRSASVTLPKGDLDAGALRVRGADIFQTVAALSLDGEPLETSRSILLIQLTNLSNTKALFANSRWNLMRKEGGLPILIRRGRATVEIAGPALQVTALKTDGSPYGKVKSEYRNGATRFTADTGLYPGGVMAYHLTR